MTRYVIPESGAVVDVPDEKAARMRLAPAEESKDEKDEKDEKPAPRRTQKS